MAHAAEVDIRLASLDDYMFKVNTTSMRKNLGVEIAMLDKYLDAFGLNMPHVLKIKGKMCKHSLH